MKILIINGSPRHDGNTSIAIQELVRRLSKNGIETDIVEIKNNNIRGCIACNKCKDIGKCIFDDIVNETAEKFNEVCGLVIASPVYYAQANATLIAFLQRLFYSTSNIDKTMKIGASIAVCRRGGASSTFDELNKFFTISNMPIVSSKYWNSVHGQQKGDAKKDFEGLQTMRVLADNITFLVNSIELGKEKFGLPKKEKPITTNFISQ